MQCDITLMEYQKEAILKMKPGCILNGGVGSGKSITSLVFYLSKICKHKSGMNQFGETYQPLPGSPDLYIITTAAKRDSGEWLSELTHFSLSLGSNKFMGGVNVVVDSWNNMHKYQEVKDAFFIFDEQHLTGKGAWVKSFYKIAKVNQWILLTATPGDTWMDYAPVFIANGFYKNRRDFERRHVVYSRWSKYPVVDRWLDEGRLIRLRNSILVTMKSPKGAERVPPHVITVGYDKNAYKRIMKDRWNIEKDQPISNYSEMAMCLRRLVNSEERRLVETANICKKVHKAIIFYNLNCELDQLRRLEDITGIPVYERNGHKHDQVPSGKEWIYLVQYASGCEAWNCTKTNVIIFYSLNYSYKTMEQAAGRIDRMNTPYKQLHYYVIQSFSPIDVGIIRSLKNKKKFQPVEFLKKTTPDKELS